jgi:hypothetical protein
VTSCLLNLSGLIGHSAAMELQEVLRELDENDQSVVAEESGSDFDDGVPMTAKAKRSSATASSSTAPWGTASAASSSAAPPVAARSRWFRFGVVERGSNAFFTPEGQSLGNVHHIGTHGVKATCRRHKRCCCWLSKTMDPPQALDDLVEWLARVSDDSHTHLQAARAIKVKHGMKPR